MIIQKKVDDSKFKSKNNSDKKKPRYKESVVDLLEKFFKIEGTHKIENNNLYFCCLLIPKCDICHKNIESADDFDKSYYCKNCSKFSHVECHKEEFKNECINCQN